MFEDIHKVYPFVHYQYLVGKNIHDLDSVITYCLDHGICVLALRMNLAKPEYVRKIRNAGLYVMIGYEDTEAFQFISSLIEGLSYSGIGGKRTSGYGKFQAKYKNMDPQLKQRLNVNKYQKIG